jgi:hypothetical protein
MKCGEMGATHPIDGSIAMCFVCPAFCCARNIGKNHRQGLVKLSVCTDFSIYTAAGNAAMQLSDPCWQSTLILLETLTNH